MNPFMVLLLLPLSKAWEQEPAGSMAKGCPERSDCGSWKKSSSTGALHRVLLEPACAHQV